MGGQNNGGLLKPIWDAAFKPWKLSKELVVNCNLIPLCQYIWELISDNKTTYTTVSHLQLGLCILLSKKYEILYQKSINLSRLLTSGQQDANKSLKQLVDAPKVVKRINHKKKPLKSLVDEQVGRDELVPMAPMSPMFHMSHMGPLVPIGDESVSIVSNSQGLQLVPYTIEMMNLVDQTQNPDSGSNATDNYWTLLINELTSLNEDDKTTFIDSLINENNWSINEPERDTTHYYEDFDNIFNDPLSGEKLTPIPGQYFTNLNDTIIDEGTNDKLSLSYNKSVRNSYSREKNLLKYDSNIFTPKKQKQKKLNIMSGQRTLFDVFEQTEIISATPLTRALTDSITPFTEIRRNNFLDDKSDVIGSALLKLVDEAATKQHSVDDYFETNQYQHIFNDYKEVPKENFLHDLTSSSTRKLLNSYNECLGPGKKIDFTTISQNCTRHEAALMFYRTLLLSNGGLLDLHQEFSDYKFNPIFVTNSTTQHCTICTI